MDINTTALNALVTESSMGVGLYHEDVPLITAVLAWMGFTVWYVFKYKREEEKKK